MLPRKLLVKKTRWAWVAFLALSPLAYFAGLWLLLKHDPNVQVGFYIDRDQAIAKAAEFAASRGVSVAGWDAFCSFNPESKRDENVQNDLLFYYRLRSGADRDLARSIYPEAVVGVRFRSDDRRENIEVILDRTGKPLGFQRNLSKSIESKDAGEEASKKIAEAALKARLAALGISQPFELKAADPPTQIDRMRGDTSIRTYSWQWPLPSIPELTIKSVLQVRGGVLITDKLDARLDEQFAKNTLHRNSIAKLIGSFIYGAVILIVVIFGIYRFIQRVREKEVSYSRALLLAAIFTVVTCAYILVMDVAVYEVSGIPDFPANNAVILFTSSMFYGMVSVLLGLAYGSGEGDIREAYPGKLSSLDALITGKIFSKNVARSVISGWAFGGWMFLFTNAVLLPWQDGVTSGEEFGPLDSWFGAAPWVFSLTSWSMDVILVIVIGLLIPLPFIRRRSQSPRVIIPFLAFFIWVASSGPYLGFRPWTAIMAMAAVRTALVMLAFFKFDLLTAIVGLASPTFISFVVALIAQPSASLSRSGTISLSIALAIQAIEFFFAFKGRNYREDEVRPVYAKLLAERLSMQAEVSAAREAQKRLMPEQLPSSEQFSVAAVCLPAFEVGGDYYDLFELEPGKLGVIIAEGGGRGLGSALSIAFAKGFLMPKIKSPSRTDDSPTEIIRALQDKLKSRLEENVSVGFVFAVIDSYDGIIRYARTGAHPTVMISREKSGNDLVRIPEHSIKFKSHFKPDEDISVIEGSFSMQPGDSAIFFTDGIAKDWADHKTSPEIEIGKVITESRDSESVDLQENLEKSVNDCSKRAKKRGLEDDLTIVVVRLEKTDEISAIERAIEGEEKAI